VHCSSLPSTAGEGFSGEPSVLACEIEAQLLRRMRAHQI
jgi:hypothetical protein